MKLDCPVCGHARMTSIGEHADRRKGLSGSWEVYACASCQVLALRPTPTPDQLSEYYSVYSKGERVNFALGRGARYPRLRKLMHWVSGDVDPRDFIDADSGVRVLDYGCGQAGSLIDFHAKGVAISGAEIAEDVVVACRDKGLDVHKVDSFSHIPFPDETFDIVYLMQVFEHLREPHVFMQELARILKDGGVLYLAVPNADSIWRKVFGNNWVSGWFAPFHLFHYNRVSLINLARQHGFDLVDSWSRTPESWFRLNLKAWLYPQEKQLDWKRSWLDRLPVRVVLMLMLRVAELLVSERDCLVVKLRKAEKS